MELRRPIWKPTPSDWKYMRDLKDVEVQQAIYMPGQFLRVQSPYKDLWMLVLPGLFSPRGRTVELKHEISGGMM